MTSLARVATVRLSSLFSPAFRLDAKYYQEAFTLAKARVAGCGIPIKEVNELATAFVPGRTALITSPNENAGAPYLRAHDAFDTLPTSERYVVATRMRDYESYLLAKGMILTPSSGRNLGPLAFVGDYLSRFCMTDILRIVPESSKIGYYLLAYLMTPTGQALIRRGRTGTTVDHLAPSEVLSIPVVWPDDDLRETCTNQMRESQHRLDRARQILNDAEHEMHERAGLRYESLTPDYYNSDTARTFTQTAGSLVGRLDAAYYDPIVSAACVALKSAGSCRLDEAAELLQMGRYKRYYVEAPHGRPILSGSHLTQLHPVNLQRISDRSFRNPEAFAIKTGWTIFTCDGRAEESLGATAYVSSLWNGWMASNHVMRAIPRQGYHPGYLYLALRSPFVQLQLKTRATGNVVDALDIPTIADVTIPALDRQMRDYLGKRTEQAWEQVAQAIRLEEETVIMLEKVIVDSYESNTVG